MLRLNNRSPAPTLFGALIGLLGAGEAVSAEPAKAPRIVAVWPAGLLETSVAFETPIDAATARSLVGATIRVDSGFRDLAARKRANTHLPAQSLGAVRIAAATRLDDGRTLRLAVDPQPREAVYTLPGLPAQGSKTSPAVTYDLSGVSVSWDGGKEGDQAEWSGWWPELDPEECRRLMTGSQEHERGFALLAKPGRFTLAALLRLPPGRVTVRLEANRPLEAAVNGDAGEAAGQTQAECALDSTGDDAVLTVSVRTGPGDEPVRLRAFYRVDEATEQPIHRERLVVPWAVQAPPNRPLPNPLPFSLAGGNRERGRVLFFGDRAKCANCHRVDGKGGAVGPDLSGPLRPTSAEIYQAIADPSASILPDFISYSVVQKDGRIVSGIVRAENAASIRVVDTDAKVTIVRRDAIEEIRPSSASIMPVGLVGAVGEEGVRDLIAFLTSRDDAK